MASDNLLRELAAKVARDWTHGAYYEEAERGMEIQWAGLIWPLIHAGSDFSVTLDLAAGHGRNTEMLRRVSGRVIAVDVNASNVEFIRQRFADHPEVDVVQNSGLDLGPIPDESVTFVYSFDAMVHFYPEVVQAYIPELYRVMRPAARGFIHYSNRVTGGRNYKAVRGWRNVGGRERVEGWMREAGLEVLRTVYIADVGVVVPEDTGDCDAATVFRRP
jgi:SAM-dependent methyltransferase